VLDAYACAAGRASEHRVEQTIGAEAWCVVAGQACLVLDRRDCRSCPLVVGQVGRVQRDGGDCCLRIDRRRVDEDRDVAPDAFPSVNPRPVTPDMTPRFDASPQPVATQMKFVVDTNQCTGQMSYQGDQDLDPAVNADCRNGTGISRATEVNASELEVFGSTATIDGT
jgi:hypothetical protein